MDSRQQRPGHLITTVITNAAQLKQVWTRPSLLTPLQRHYRTHSQQ
ncbi:hypothetical protein [Streptomyces sp. NPDC012825]